MISSASSNQKLPVVKSYDESSLSYCRHGKGGTLAISSNFHHFDWAPCSILDIDGHAIEPGLQKAKLLTCSAAITGV
eukprot:6471629-Amphidinium_carterae.3